MRDECGNRVLLIFTGGTIAMDSETLSSLHTAREILDFVPEIKSLALVDACQVCNIDSVEMKPSNWVEIARLVYERYDDYDGFVVLHGTDTMAYSAAALSFILQNLGKPVIFTGSQIPLASRLATDARNNLINSVRYALMDIAEVCIFFGTQLLRGNRARKISGFDINAFKSFSDDPLGTAGVRLSLSRDARHRSQARPLLRPRLVTEVFLLKVFPSLSNDAIDGLVSIGSRGIVLETYGTGNLPIGPQGLVPGIRRAIEAGVTIVVATQCEMGSAEDLYPSGKLLKEMGALMAHDMTPETALVKLMWVLGNAAHEREVRDLMLTNITKEFSWP
ncbi:MAG: asparaginase [Candidatus Eremiobacteraeota bacterium]|nr:asparaginase [Candidatus Eremiobacteraeota bacterium]